MGILQTDQITGAACSSHKLNFQRKQFVQWHCSTCCAACGHIVQATNVWLNWSFRVFILQ